MNRKRMLAMADKIEKLPLIPMSHELETAKHVATHNAKIARALAGKRARHFFNMALYDGNVRTYKFIEDAADVREAKNCGTVGCIAGSVAQLARLVGHRRGYTAAMAADYLGLSEDEAERLFCPDLNIDIEKITPKQAARAMRLMARGDDPWDGQGIT